MIDEESVDQWVEGQIPQLQLEVVTSINTYYLLHMGVISSLIEELAMQDMLVVELSEQWQVSMARRWIWITTEAMSELTFFTHIVDIAVLFHPYVFSYTYCERLVRDSANALDRAVSIAESRQLRQHLLRGPLPSSSEPDARTPDDDDVLECMSSDDDI